MASIILGTNIGTHPIKHEHLTNGLFITLRNHKQNYGLLLVGALSGNPERYSRAYCGLFTETGLMPKKKLSKFRVTGNAVVQPGTQLRASHFQPGQFVDILGRRHVNSLTSW